jgi:uncharacterized phage protein (TIGR01671 family)
MREILFRGQKQNGEWLHGDLVHYGEKILIFSENAQNSPDYYEVDPETVGQFTGLTDKNGVKIFEGDKVYFDYNYIGEIIVSWDISGKFNIQGYVFSKCKIIGNVHENTKN